MTTGLKHVPGVWLEPQLRLVLRYKNGDRGQTYSFSRVFNEDTAQEQFFQATAQPMVRQLLRSRTSSVMIAYGTSAAGKTYTIEVPAPIL